MALAHVTALLCLAAAAGCGSSPLDPSPGDFTTLLPDGRYLFTVNALPGRPGCSPAWEPAIPSARVGEISIRREGNEWVGRAGSPLGLELRIYSTGGTRIAGTIRGDLVTTAAPDPAGRGDAIGLGASFGAVDSDGRFLSGDLPFGSSGHGRVEGRVTFVDRARAPMACPEAEWAITPSLL